MTKSSHFEVVGIIGKYGVSDISSPLDQVIRVLKNYKCDVLLDIETLPKLQSDYDYCSRDELVSRSDLIVAIGGDGSFLAASRSAIIYDKPITGVNMGRLGFLTDINPETITSELPSILQGNYKHEKRTVISSRLHRDHQLIKSNIAINDVVIHKSSMARMIELDVYLDGMFLSSYRADGLIVATPTGSTAYALSSGGPILQGSLSTLVLVPICPHTLTQRPIVIDANRQLQIEVTSHESVSVQMTIDGQDSVVLEKDDVICVSKNKESLNIFHPNSYNELQRLRHKLKWGSSPDHPLQLME